MTDRLVVIGGDAAGMSAASQARKRRDRRSLDILALEKGTVTSYSACGIPYWIGGTVDDRDELVARTPETFRKKYDIDVRLRNEVVAIDTEEHTVRVRDQELGDEFDEYYDDLVIATGATPFRPPVENIGAEGIFGVQTLDDGSRILEAMEAWDPQRAVVVGGGYIGLEMAEAMVQRGLHVTVVDRAPQPMSTVDSDLGVMIAEAMRSMGIELTLGQEVEGFEMRRDGRVASVRTAETAHPADIVVLGMGTRPNTDLAARADIPIGPTGGIVTDARQRTGVVGVWAVGDCAETRHLVSGRPVAIALGTIANKQGRVAGINLGGGYATFPGVVGTAVTKVCGVEIARTGLNEAEAAAAGFLTVTATVESSTRARYFPGAERLTMKVIAERRSGRLLGAQIVGAEGAAKRIDVFATALWNGMVVGELLNVDLSYAPPFAPVWDPVLIAARKAWQAVEEDLPDCR